MVDEHSHRRARSALQQPNRARHGSNCGGNSETKRCNERIARCQPQPAALVLPPSINKCTKCMVPVSDGGCKCNDNCDCIYDKCAKCNVPVSDGGCKCDDKCECKGFGRRLQGASPYSGRGRALLQEGNGLCTGVKISG